MKEILETIVLNIVENKNNVEVLEKIEETAIVYEVKVEKEDINTNQIVDWFQDENIISRITEIMAEDFEITDIDKAIDDLVGIYEKQKLVNRRNEILKKLDTESSTENMKELEKELNNIILKLAKIK